MLMQTHANANTNTDANTNTKQTWVVVGSWYSRVILEENSEERPIWERMKERRKRVGRGEEGRGGGGKGGGEGGGGRGGERNINNPSSDTPQNCSP
jgi:hypothetical protein